MRKPSSDRAYVTRWARQTENYRITEYEARSGQIFCCVSALKEHEVARFNGLGIHRKKLDKASDEMINALCKATLADKDIRSWQISPLSFWDNLPDCFPSLEQYIEQEDATPEGGEQLGKVWVFLSDEPDFTW